MPKINIRQLFGVSEPVFDPSCKLVTSPFFSSTVLAIIRLLIALYTMTTLIVILVLDGIKAAGDFSYFTQLTYVGICAYNWASFVQTAFYESRRRKGGSGYPLQQWPKWLQALHLILMTTIVTYPILVTIVFWGLLAGPTTLGTTTQIWRNTSVHALNSVFCLFEMLCTHSPRPRWIFLPCSILMLGAYCGLAYVTKETQGFYAYPFLNPDRNPMLPIYMVGIAIAECLIFIIAWGLMTLRHMWFPVSEKVLGDDGSLDGIRSKWIDKDGRESV